MTVRWQKNIRNQLCPIPFFFVALPFCGCLRPDNIILPSDHPGGKLKKDQKSKSPDERKYQVWSFLTRIQFPAHGDLIDMLYHAVNHLDYAVQEDEFSACLLRKMEYNIVRGC